MRTISEIWFTDKRIFMKTGEGAIFSRPLEAFPLLLEASEKQRDAFHLNKFKDAIRWECIDEDIHIDSFYTEEEPHNNPVGNIFKRYPQINVSAFAQQIGINKSLLAKYIYGIKTPSPARLKEIQDGMQKLGRELAEVEFA